MRRIYSHQMTGLQVKRMLEGSPSRWERLLTIVKGVGRVIRRLFRLTPNAGSGGSASELS